MSRSPWVPFSLALVLSFSLMGCAKRSRKEGAGGKREPELASDHRPVAAGPAARKPGSPAPLPVTQPSCPADRRIKLDEEAWTRKLRQARGRPEINALLAEVGLQGIAEAPGYPPGKAPLPQVSLVKLEPAAFSSDQPEDRLIQVVFTGSSKGGAYTSDPVAFYQLRYGVLLSLGGGEYCRLTGALAVDRDSTERPCLGGDERRLLLDVKLVNLVHAKRQTMLVYDQTGACGGGSMRAGNVSLYYDQPTLAGIVRVLSLQLYRASYTSPRPPAKEESAEIVAIEGGYPKAIVRIERTKCDAQGGSPDDGPCMAKAERIRATYQNGRYVDGPREAVKGAAAESLADADLGFQDPRQGAGWGERCYKHLQADRLENARAACRRGLESSPSAAVKGALLYNLALVEIKAKEANEPLGAVSACDHLKASLAARPGNEAVQAKLEALDCKR